MRERAGDTVTAGISARTSRIILLLSDSVGDLGETMRSTVHCGPGPADKIESEGLRNDVSNESFTGSGRATERREGDGRRIEDSYVLSVSLAQVLSRTDGGGGEGGAGGEGCEIWVRVIVEIRSLDGCDVVTL